MVALQATSYYVSHDPWLQKLLSILVGVEPTPPENFHQLLLITEHPTQSFAFPSHLSFHDFLVLQLPIFSIVLLLHSFVFRLLSVLQDASFAQLLH